VILPGVLPLRVEVGGSKSEERRRRVEVEESLPFFSIRPCGATKGRKSKPIKTIG